MDGRGLRYTLFTQGCPHRCEGCHNPQTHDFEGGEEASAESVIAEIEGNTLLDGVTFSGGEPFSQAAELVKIARYCKGRGLDVWIYSGWTYEELTELSGKDESMGTLLGLCDVLVDGRFELDKRTLSQKWVGSTNQRVIDLARTRETGVTSLYREPASEIGFEVPRWE